MSFKVREARFFIREKTTYQAKTVTNIAQGVSYIFEQSPPNKLKG
jgi:hypothetical protein